MNGDNETNTNIMVSSAQTSGERPKTPTQVRRRPLQDLVTPDRDTSTFKAQRLSKGYEAPDGDKHKAERLSGAQSKRCSDGERPAIDGVLAEVEQNDSRPEGAGRDECGVGNGSNECITSMLRLRSNV